MILHPSYFVSITITYNILSANPIIFRFLSQNNLSCCCNIFDNIEPYSLSLSLSLSFLQYQLSLLSTNKSSSSRILPKPLARPIFLSHHLVLNSIEPDDNIVSNSIASNGNIVSHSITPIIKMVYHNIVNKPNLFIIETNFLLVSFSIYSICEQNYFSFHSNLYFDVHLWILSLLPLFRLLVSSFRLEFFFYFSVRMIPLVY